MPCRGPDLDNAGSVLVTARVSKILIVDDTPHNIDVLSATLDGEHCELMAATSGARALELAGRSRPELVLLDVMMPGMDGFEVCRRLRARPTLNHVRIIAMTGFPSTENVERIMSAGADACLPKPLDPERLLAALGL
jgi:two-component system, cell cycle response regulator